MQFVHVCATILPETGVDQRPAPLTMDYVERYEKLRRQLTIDEVLGPMVPYKDQQAIPANSPLYNEDELPEFETEYSHSIHMSEQALSKMLKDYNF